MNHVPSKYQHADILTKALAFDVFVIHRRFLMNSSVWLVYFVFVVDRRFDVCILISVCFWVCVNAACVMTQLGGCLSRVGYITHRINKVRIRGAIIGYLSDHT